MLLFRKLRPSLLGLARLAGSRDEGLNLEREDKLKLNIKSIDYHRNGISGAGFHVVRFADGERPNMLACVFEEPGHVAVLNVDNLTDCWRGDHYEAALRKAIEKYRSLEAG